VIATAHAAAPIRILLQLYRLTRVFSRHFSCLLIVHTRTSIVRPGFELRVGRLQCARTRRACSVYSKTSFSTARVVPGATVPTRRNTSTPRLARCPRPRHAAARRPCVSGFRVPRSRDTRFGRERAPAVRRRRPVAVPACNTLLIGFGPRFARGLVPIGIILDVAPVVTVQHSSKLGSLGSPGSRALLIHFLSLLLLCRGRGR